MDMSMLKNINMPGKGGPEEGKPEKEKKPDIEYTAQAASSLVNGEVKMKINDNGLAITALFDAVEIRFSEINSLDLADYAVMVKTDDGDYRLSKMGNWCQPFYDALSDAYNGAVLRSFFVEDDPIIKAKGDYRYAEKGSELRGKAAFRVHKDCVVSLPPDLGGRRIPLCFLSGMSRKELEIELKLDTGDTYTFSRMGYDTVPFADAVEKQIRAMREMSTAAVKEIDSSLSATQASQISKIMPEGVAAPFGKLQAIAPSFVEALEAKITGTRAAESYTIFKELCDPSLISVGFKKIKKSKEEDEAPEVPEVEEGAEDGEEKKAPDTHLMWLVAPSPDGQSAAVEFTETDAATFVYRTNRNYDDFSKQLNRALEAIDFKREVIRMTDEELRKPENSDYYMASKRTVSLQFIRSNFVGRVIHNGAENWKRKLTEMW
jgi:hypothetical protein